MGDRFSGRCGDNLQWIKNEEKLNISRIDKSNPNGEMWDNPEFPDEIKDTTELVTFRGVTYIGEASFEGFDLTEAELSDSLVEIGDGAFKDCVNLDVELPESLEIIGKQAFENTGISNVTIMNSKVTIKEEAFYGCDNLEEATIFAGKVDSRAFAGCKNLENATLGPATTIGYNVFSPSKNLNIDVKYYNESYPVNADLLRNEGHTNITESPVMREKEDLDQLIEEANLPQSIVIDVESNLDSISTHETISNEEFDEL